MLKSNACINIYQNVDETIVNIFLDNILSKFWSFADKCFNLFMIKIQLLLSCINFLKMFCNEKKMLSFLSLQTLIYEYRVWTAKHQESVKWMGINIDFLVHGPQ